MECPDFSRYSEKQLRQILRMLDGERYPDRLKEVQARLAAFDANKENENPPPIPLDGYQLISSKISTLMNAVVAVLFFGGGLVFAFVFLIAKEGGIGDWLFFLAFFGLGLAALAMLHRQLEQVYLADDRLLLVRRGERELVSLSSVREVEVQGGESTTVVLHLDCSTKFGNKVEFSPAMEFSLNPFKRIAVVDELKRRISAAKAQTGSVLSR